MPVYMIRAGEHGPVKIGWADDVGARREQLQTSHHDTLTVLRVIQGNRSTERWLHDRFAEHRLRGEWFTFRPEMLEVIPPRALPEEARSKKLRLPLVSWAADMCSIQKPCAQCRAVMDTPGHPFRDHPQLLPWDGLSRMAR